ncbi:MAG: heat-inducible transcriptional repressor HrcA [bacterium]
MRALKTEDLEDRKKKVLQSVIHQYIKTARPVGSKALTAKGLLDLSSATIRNILSDLEDEGYITHPHTSAGRIPTDKGYRYYVESLAEIQRLAIDEEQRIKHECSVRIKEMQDIMGKTSRILSAISHHTGFVLSPKIENNRLKHVSLVTLDEYRILALLVTDSGLIKHHIVRVDQKILPARIAQLEKILNSQLSGLTLQEVNDQMVSKIKEEEREYKTLVSFAHSFADQFFEDYDDGLYVDGASNLISQDDFDDVSHVKSIYRLIDEKRVLSQMLRKQLPYKSKGNIKVTIGDDNMCPELRKFSLVSSVYNVKGNNVGMLGIIGPKRMEYDRMISLVSYVTKMLNKVFEENEDEW